MEILLAVIFGAAVGSFLNVVIDRLSTGRGFLTGRSYCEHCKKTLKPIDLIPLLSYIFLQGKCRYCKVRIPFRLFFVELLSASLFGWLALSVLIGSLELIPAILLGIILLGFIGIFFADIEYGIIPDALVAIICFVTIFYLVIQGMPIFPNIIAGISSFAFFLFLFIVTKGKGMGFGDVKLAFSMGFLLGFPLIIIALYIAFLTGAAVAIILVIWRKLRFFGGTIPFGPFLVGGTIAALFWGNIIISQFLKGIL